MNKITRSTVNEQQYSAPEFPKSGFPLSYRRYSSFGLGKIHVGGFQFTMPGDKMSGQTRGQLTFHRIVTPIVSPINAMQYNVYLPLRPLDRSFEKGITPTKLNGMSASWTMPQFNTRSLVDQLMRYYFDGVPGGGLPSAGVPVLLDLIAYLRSNPTKTLLDFCNAQTPAITVADLLYTGQDALVGIPVSCLTTSGKTLYDMASDMYMCDSLLEISESIIAKLGTVSTPLSGSMLVSDFINLYFSTLLTPWIGRYSYYGEFKYEFLRPFDFYRLSRMSIAGLPLSPTWDDFLSLFSDTPQNEYAIRAMYAVWYELFRNVDLEPVSNTLPDWREFGSTSIFDESNSPNMCYLLYRIRSWERDMFISAQIDDLSRHVYAPIISTSDGAASYHEFDMNNIDTQHPNSDEFPRGGNHKPAIYTLGYLDQLSGTTLSIDCPVPSNINDVLSATDKSFHDVYGLDLNTLRQSQMLERYLKRNYLFGDEYKDRMLAHYNSRVSDMRINKPEILSQSLNSYDMKQEVSNVSTDETKVGDRTATATCEVKGEPYTTFCEEFGIIISLVCIMPRSMYDGTCPQHLLAKEVDLPKPEFATNNEEFGRKLEIAGSGLFAGGPDDDPRYMFGRYPAYHAWRSRVDEVGGEFLDELQECTFRRFFGMFSEDTTPKLNYFFLHCRPNLNMFANNLAYDMQAYGDLVHECFVERVLPTPVETI